MITLTLQGESLEGLKQAMSAALAEFGGKPAVAPSPRGGKTKETAAAPPPADEPEEDPSQGITYERVSGLVVRISKEKGRDAVINFLKSFTNPANGKGATKGAEIAPADYPAVVAQAEKLLAEEDDVA